MPSRFAGISVSIISEPELMEMPHDRNIFDEYHWYLSSSTFILATRFLLDMKSFEDLWSTQSDEQKDIKREDILFNIQQLDELLSKAKSGVSCRKAILYATTAIFFKVRKTTEDRELNRPEDAHSVPYAFNAEVVGNNKDIIRKLDAILPPYGTDAKYGEISPEFDRLIDATSAQTYTECIARRLREIVEACKHRKSDDKTLSTSSEAPPNLDDTEPTGGERTLDGIEDLNRIDDDPGDEPTDNDIDDILIWRTILMGLLFWTAPDNTSLLNSGLWDQVIPLL